MPLFQDFWNKISQSPSYKPAQITINPMNTDKTDLLAKPFKRYEQYFLVRVNEMYLSYKRKWLSEYDPIVFVVSEFMYDGEKVSVPYVVGPSMLNNKLDKVPEGMIFKDTIVAGLHPFGGGEFAVSVVLARMRQKDYLRKMLKVIENISGTYQNGFATMVNQYIKVANVVVDGIDSLLDTEDVEPIIGFRKSFHSDVDNFTPGYFALVNKDELQVKEDNFFIKNNSLFYGDSKENLEEHRKDDYVLYSIMSAPTRSDYESLAFHKQWQEIGKTIGDMRELDQDNKDIINGKLFSLQAFIENSPDLTRNQAEERIDFYLAEVEKIIARRSKRLSGDSAVIESQPETDEWKNKMKELSLKILRSK